MMDELKKRSNGSFRQPHTSILCYYRVKAKRSEKMCYKADFIESSKPFVYVRLNGAPHDPEVFVQMTNQKTLDLADGILKDSHSTAKE